MTDSVLFPSQKAEPHASAPDAPRENSLLAALSQATRDLLQSHRRDRTFQEGTVLWDVGDRVDRVYFPITGMISLVIPNKDVQALEVGSIGHEGAAGLNDLGTRPATTRGIVQIRGTFACITAGDFIAAMQQSQELRDLVDACKDWLLVQAQQIAVCNAVHSADARFARWLLRAADATANDVIAVTQEAVAEMLGVRRTTVTLIAQNLQNAHIIRYRRGVITIADRAGLEAAACDCCRTSRRGFWPSVVMAEPEQAPSISPAVG